MVVDYALRLMKLKSALRIISTLWATPLPRVRYRVTPDRDEAFLSSPISRRSGILARTFGQSRTEVAFDDLR